MTLGIAVLIIISWIIQFILKDIGKNKNRDNNEIKILRCPKCGFKQEHTLQQICPKCGEKLTDEYVYRKKTTKHTNTKQEKIKKSNKIKKTKTNTVKKTRTGQKNSNTYQSKISNNFSNHNKYYNGKTNVEDEILLTNAYHDYDYVKIKSLILNNIVDVNTRFLSNGRTILFTVYENGEIDFAEWLVEHGADVNVIDKNGWSVLSVALNVMVMARLAGYYSIDGIEYNANDNIDIFYQSELDNIKYLVNHGADVNARLYCGRTILFDACRSGNLELVKYLVEEKLMDIKTKDNNGKTALDMAIHDRIVDYLKSIGGYRKKRTKIRKL